MANTGAGYGLASHACKRCVLRFDMVFDRRTRGVVAESARSRDGVVAEKHKFCGTEWWSRDSACEVVAALRKACVNLLDKMML